MGRTAFYAWLNTDVAFAAAVRQAERAGRTARQLDMPGWTRLLTFAIHEGASRDELRSILRTMGPDRMAKLREALDA